MAVLRGALATLEREHPALLIEIEERHRPGEGDSVQTLLAPLGYAVYQCDGVGITTARVTASNNYLFLTPAHLVALGSQGIRIQTS